MNIRDVSDTGEVITPEIKPMESEKNVTAPVFPELAQRAIQDAVGLENDSEKYKYDGKVQTLLDYVKSVTTDLSPENVKAIIRRIELEVGSPPISEKRVSYLARYAFLAMEEQKIKSEREAMKG